MPILRRSRRSLCPLIPWKLRESVEQAPVKGANSVALLYLADANRHAGDTENVVYYGDARRWAADPSQSVVGQRHREMKLSVCRVVIIVNGR